MVRIIKEVKGFYGVEIEQSFCIPDFAADCRAFSRLTFASQGRELTPAEALQLHVAFKCMQPKVQLVEQDTEEESHDLPDAAFEARNQCSCCREQDLNAAEPAFARAVCAVLDLNPYFLSTSKMIAFASITHERLGVHCSGWTQLLSSDILEHICMCCSWLDAQREQQDFCDSLFGREKGKPVDEFMNLSPITLLESRTWVEEEMGFQTRVFLASKKSILDMTDGEPIRVKRFKVYAFNGKERQKLNQVISGLSLNSKGKIGHLILVSDAHCEEDEEDEEDEDEEDEDEEDEDEEFDHL